MVDVKLLIRPLQAVWELANIEWGKRYSDIYPVLISGYRSPEEQLKLYAKGRTEPGPIVTNLKFGKHQEGKAIDITFKSKSTGKVYWTQVLYYKEFFDICKAIDSNISWGGNWKNFKDYGHLEYK